MKKYEKILATFVLSLVIFSLSFSLAFAASKTILERLTAVGAGPGWAAPGTTDAAYVVGGIIKVFLSLLGVIFISYILYASWLWMTAAGNDEKISKAKVVIRGSVIGLIIALSAYIITATVINRLQGSTLVPTTSTQIRIRLI